MYQALYRRYRPRTFDQILGQEHNKNIEDQTRMGISGMPLCFLEQRHSKTSTAKILSRAVNCLDLKDGNPCNQCEICRILSETIAMS